MYHIYCVVGLTKPTVTSYRKLGFLHYGFLPHHNEASKHNLIKYQSIN